MIARLVRLHLKRCFATCSLQDVEVAVFNALKSVEKLDKSKLSKEATFQQLGLDSLDQMEVVVALEEKLMVDLPDNEVEKISSVNDAINTFMKYLK